MASKDKGCGSPRCGSRIVHGTNVNAGQYGHAHDSALSPEHVRTEKLNQGITSRTTRYPCGIQRLVSTHSNSYLSGRGGDSWLLKLKLKVPPTFHFRGRGYSRLLKVPSSDQFFMGGGSRLLKTQSPKCWQTFHWGGGGILDYPRGELVLFAK